jgi:YegS/Rv2252/BmrU family lipid kinase
MLCRNNSASVAGSGAEVLEVIGYNRFFERLPKIISHSFQRIGIVFNPFAGGLKGAKRSRLDRAAQILERAGYSVELFATTGPNSAGDVAAQAADRGCQCILAAGGDGTINEAINGIARYAGSPDPVIFGVLPAGTANVFANEVGFSNRPDVAARQLLDAEPVHVALGLFQEAGREPRYFLLMAGIGLDARIVYELDAGLKRRVGKLAYWHGGFRQLGRPVPRFSIAVNGTEYKASFALITRVRNYGGDFEIARRIQLTDNDFEVIVFTNNQWQDYLRFFAAVVLNRLDRTPGVLLTRATEMQLTAPEDQRIYVQTDGESVGNLPATISIAPDAVRMLLPARYIAQCRRSRELAYAT